MEGFTIIDGVVAGLLVAASSGIGFLFAGGKEAPHRARARECACVCVCVL